MPDNAPSDPAPQAVPPQDKKPKAVLRQFQVRATFAEHFSGPLPPPELLDRYEKVVPGTAERILRMAEKEQDHRHNLEASLPALARQGQLFGFVLGLSGIIGGVVLVAMGRSLAGFGVFLVSLGSLVGAYMYGHKASVSGEDTKEPAPEARTTTTTKEPH